MKIVVITGSTRGIGFGLAGSLLERGCSLVISGRSAQTTSQAAARLAEKHPPDRILAHPCDVTETGQVQALWDAAVARFGRVDIWINNAGLAHPQKPIHELDPDTMRQVIETNLVGTLNGARVALRGMRAQGFGALYNLEGAGSDGRKIPGLGVYSASKYATRYLDEVLAREGEGSPVLVGSLSPGMVVTDLLTGQNEGSSAAEQAAALRAFNLLADRVETVTPWLAGQVLANTKNGARIRWLTPTKIVSRLVGNMFRRRKIIEDTP